MDVILIDYVFVVFCEPMVTAGILILPELLYNETILMEKFVFNQLHLQLQIQVNITVVCVLTGCADCL